MISKCQQDYNDVSCFKGNVEKGFPITEIKHAVDEEMSVCDGVEDKIRFYLQCQVLYLKTVSL